jgi:P-type Cu2+ transporter
MNSRTTVLQVGGLSWATSAAVVEQTLERRPGVLAVEANALSQTANVTYDPDRTDVAQLSGWVRDCGFHCGGQSVPEHVCDPMAEPAEAAAAQVHSGQEAHEGAGRSAQDVMGHGGGHGGMSMQDMVADMRNRFLVAVVLSVPILFWSPIGREVLGFTVPAPFGLRDDVFSLLLSVPVIFYSAWVAKSPAMEALRRQRP